jgi:hypothetical protein
MTERHGGLDFGLPHLVRAFHDRWRAEGGDLEVVTAYTVQFPLTMVEAVLADTLRLTGSAVPPWAIEALWSAGTERRHDLLEEGRDGRDWLDLLSRLCVERLGTEGPDHPRSVPPSPYAHLTGAVLDEIALVSPGLAAASLGSGRRHVPGVVPALEQVALHACPDLAFRFLLRLLANYGPGIPRSQYERWAALGAAFEYGELMIEGYEHLVD